MFPLNIDKFSEFRRPGLTLFYTETVEEQNEFLNALHQKCEFYEHFLIYEISI